MVERPSTARSSGSPSSHFWSVGRRRDVLASRGILSLEETSPGGRHREIQGGGGEPLGEGVGVVLPNLLTADRAVLCGIPRARTPASPTARGGGWCSARTTPTLKVFAGFQ